MTPTPMAFEIESLVPTASYSSSSSAMPGRDCRRVARRVPRRISSFVAIICFLIFIAVAMNVIGSFSMNMVLVSPLDVDAKNQIDKKGKPKPLSQSNQKPSSTKRTRTVPPTRAPAPDPRSTKQPTQAQTQSPHPRTGPASIEIPTAVANANAHSPISPISKHTHNNNNNNINNNSNASHAFTDRWCDLQGVDWYPVESKAWQQRAPAFILPGAKMSGTSTLAQQLHQHPDIIKSRSTELQFFYESNFRRYVTAQERTKVLAARERMYATDYSVSALKKQNQNQNNKIAFDATPGYLFYSSILPRRILCVMPWIKLVVIVRDPVDRVFAHYVSATRKGLALSFQDWIEKEFALADRVGLLNTTTIEEEDVAWYNYLSATLEGALGRGLYEIQLRQWFQALRAVGRDPAEAVLIVQAESLQANPDLLYPQVLQFLGLSTTSTDNTSLLSTLLVKDTQTITAETRQRLEAFYAPYGARLQGLVQSYRVRMLT